MNGYTRFKTWLATTITAGVSTMECAFVFLALALYGFPGWQATPAQYVQWTSQTLIQLVMLSILAVQAKITQDMHGQHRQEIARLHEKIDRLNPTTPRRDARGRFVKRSKEQAS